MDTTHSILRSAKAFFAGTLLSRLSGFLREIVVAAIFGSSPEIAAFMVSYRLANVFRRLLGEGNLQAGFVPHFSALKEEGGHYFRDVAFSMALVLLAVVALLEMVLWGSLHLVASDWTEIVELTMWMVPGLFFVCLYALNSSLLQCRKKYFLPAAAPVMFNFIWIAAVLLLPGVRWLAIAVTAAFAGQWLMTVSEGWRLLSPKEWLKPKLFSPDFRTLLKPLALGIVGIGAVQFNSALDAIFARLADVQGPAYLWYAIRIQQLPLALFGIALSGALLPPLSRSQDPEHRKHLLQGALKHSAALMIACTFGLFALGKPGVNLLFGHGHFSLADVEETVGCLWGYGLGLIPSVFVLLLAAKYYAEKHYRLPTMASLFAVLANIVLNAFFVFGLGWGAISIAIATSLSAFLNVAILGRGVFTLTFWRFATKMGVACAVPAAAVLGMQVYLEPSRQLLTQLAHFGVLSGVYLTGLIALAWALGLSELMDLVKRKRPEII
ncbi:MAG TPA: murein biosynthesis integral membrane protein MurJ [Chlamydiales bacterium]|nr:murein biosynthesis integral membrane protein MurJ [Chlamydiales bacterium]